MVHILGADMMRARPQELRHLRSRVGFVFQKHNLVPRLSVLSNVLHGALARKSGPRVWFQSFATGKDREEALDCLDLVGLAHLAGRRADRLSGGQSQRVAIARALMQRPEMVIADEPVASLDPSAGSEVMELFVRVMREKGLTLIFASHHLEHALQYSDRVVGLRNGQVELEADSANESAESLSEIYGTASS